MPKQVLLLIFFISLLSGCESARKAFGGKKSGPDEFLVNSRPPLSQPPDYGLRPPKIGASVKQISTVDVARTAVLGKSSINNKSENSIDSPGLKAILRDTKALSSNPSIRKVINEETSIFSQEDERFVDKLIFWVDNKPYEGTVLDPENERKRIRNAEALGKPITDGETISIKRKRKKKGLLEF